MSKATASSKSYFAVDDQAGESYFVDLANFSASGSFVQAEPGTYTFTLYKIIPADSEASVSISELGTEAVSVVNTQVSPTYTLISGRTTAAKADIKDFTDCFSFTFAGKTYQQRVTYEVSDSYNMGGTSDTVYVTEAKVPVEFSYVDGSYGQGSVQKTCDVPCTINRVIYKITP